MPERAVLLQNICEASSLVVWAAAPGSRHEESAAEKSGARPAVVAEEVACTPAALEAVKRAAECSLVARAEECSRGEAAGCSAVERSPAPPRVRGYR